jgi:hemoglobin
MQRKTIPEPPLAFGSMPDGSIDVLLQFIHGAGTAALGSVLPVAHFGQPFRLGSMVSINLGIRFYGVETGDAGESIEPEESQRRGFPIKIRKQVGDVVRLVRTLLCNRRIDVSNLRISNLRPITSDRPVTVSPAFPAFPEVGVHANLRITNRGLPPRSELRRSCSVEKTKKMQELEVYSMIGAEGFARLVAAFYRQVPQDDVLGPMYTAQDLSGAEQRLRDFLIGRFGGPHTYIEQRGHPRLRARHSPFHINQAARDRWMRLMNNAFGETALPKEAEQVLRKFLDQMSTFMINQSESGIS